MRDAPDGLSRRSAFAMAGSWLAAPAVVTSKSSDALVVNAYGGEFREVLLATVVRPFERKFGVQVNYDGTGGAYEDYARIRAAHGYPGFDVANELTPAEIVAGAGEGLLEPITEKDVPNLRHVWPRSVEIVPDYGVVHSYQYVALVWNRDRIAKPDSWADYWRPARLLAAKAKGHLLGYKPVSNLLEIYSLLMAAKLRGGGLDNMEPAWEMLKVNRDWRAASVGTSSEAAPYFENEVAWLAPFWSARAGFLVHRNYPVGYTIPREGTVGVANVAAVPIGAKNRKLAFEFINFQLDPEIHRAFSLANFSSPGRPDIDWPQDYADTQIVTEAQMAALDLPDARVIAQKRTEWNARWQEIMGE